MVFRYQSPGLTTRLRPQPNQRLLRSEESRQSPAIRALPLHPNGRHRRTRAIKMARGSSSHQSQRHTLSNSKNLETTMLLIACPLQFHTRNGTIPSSQPVRPTRRTHPRAHIQRAVEVRTYLLSRQRLVDLRPTLHIQCLPIQWPVTIRPNSQHQMSMSRRPDHIHSASHSITLGDLHSASTCCQP